MRGRQDPARVLALRAGAVGGRGDEARARPGTAERAERFRAVFERHYDAVLAYALRRVQRPADAEEIAATTFVLAWRRIEQLPEEPYTRTWLYRTAWRTLANQRRAEGREARVLERFRVLGPGSDESLDGPPLGEVDEDGVLLEAMSRLRPVDQEVLRLVAWEDLTYADAAEVLGCSLNNFAVRLHRARAALRKEIERVERRRAVPPLRRALPGADGGSPTTAATVRAPR